MTEQHGNRVLSVIVCGAGPAAEISTFIALAHERGWTVQVIATPAALEFFDQAAIEKQTGNPVKSQYSGTFEPHPPRTGDTVTDSYPWHLALDEAHRLLDSLPQSQLPGTHAGGDRSP